MRRIWLSRSIYLDAKSHRVRPEAWIDDFSFDKPVSIYVKSPEAWVPDVWAGRISDSAVYEQQLMGPEEKIFLSCEEADKYALALGATWVRRNWG
ncbi:MAG: hypothetical protein HYU38_01210 [Candidatus Tectomicrobia bacterium]|nr:hypothetical protein [Candidatus Tectomicrobia bacterium]